MSHDIAADLPVDRLRPFLIELLQAASVYEYDAETAVEAVTATGDAAEHAIAEVPGWIDLIAEGRIDPRGKPLVLAESPALLSLDGSSALGPVGVAKAATWAIEAAGRQGAAVAIVKNGRPLPLTRWVHERLARAGRIGLLTTNQTTDSHGTTIRSVAATAEGVTSLSQSSGTGDDPLAVWPALLTGGRTLDEKPSAPNPVQAEHVLVVVDPEQAFGLAAAATCLSRSPIQTSAPLADALTVSPSLRDRLASHADAHEIPCPW